MMVVLFLLSSDIETGFNNTTRGGWYKSYIQENFALFGPLPSPSFPLPLPLCNFLFYSKIFTQMIGPGTGTSPNGESIYRPAEPILLRRVFTFRDRETESAC